MKGAAAILLVDDDPSVITLLTRALQGWGYSVETVRDGEQAMKALQAGAYDLVICDKHLPKLSGAEVIERAHAKWPRLPTLLITADLNLDADLPVRPTRSLLKPFPDLAEVKSAVHAALGDRQ